MNNTINLLPIRTEEQIKTEITRFKYDIITASIILGIVVLGGALMFVNALFGYENGKVGVSIDTATKTLNSYKDVAAGYFIIDNKVNQAKQILNSRTDPNTVVSYIESLLPSNASLSNFSLDSTNSFTVTISGTDYISVAKLLVTLENPDIKLKSTEITGITFDHTNNILDFTITGQYI